MLAIFVGLVVIISATNLEEVAANRYLKEVQSENINNPNNIGRKVSAGSSAASAETQSQSHIDDHLNDDSEANESYGNYGDDPTDETHRPPLFDKPQYKKPNY